VPAAQVITNGIVSFTVVVLGVQTVFNSFFMSMLAKSSGAE
jgi:hypothetical protein